MQIHEITEGLMRNIGRGFVQGFGGVDFRDQPAADIKAALVPTNSPARASAKSGSVSKPLTPGVTVIKSNPLTFRYQKRDFLLNNQNTWIMLGPQPKAASPEMQDFLNSEAAKL